MIDTACLVAAKIGNLDQVALNVIALAVIMHV